jgi:lactate dehydrogenase-like 2-hydroxyacid dehydrogenase
MRRLVIFVAVAVFVLLFPLRVTAETPPPQANTEEQEAFLHEFDNVCSRTQDAMMLTKVELKDLVLRCDALVTKLPKLDETRRKVYARRLEQCRGLFAYVLESKKNSKD